MREFKNIIDQFFFDICYNYILYKFQKSKILLLSRNMRNRMNNNRKFNKRIKKFHFEFIKYNNHFKFEKNVDEKLFFD